MILHILCQSGRSSAIYRGVPLVQPSSTRNKNSILAITAITLLALPVLSASAGEKPFPKIVPALDFSFPEGFAIGKGHTAYNGSVDGSIYKMDLRSGDGEILVPPVPAEDDPFGCSKLGMRVDSRTNYLFVAGCFGGNALVFDADSGDDIMSYQLAPAGSTIINDLTITKDAVYFTDFFYPSIFRLPLSKNGGIPADENAAIEIPLTGDFEGSEYATANGIVSTPDGTTLIVGHSGLSKIYKVDPATGYADEIIVDPPLRGIVPFTGFIDGLVLHGRTLYILTPGDFPDDPDFPYPEGIEPVLEDMIQVVELDKDMLTGKLVGTITDPGNLDGIASGALFGKSLYVNNARYVENPDLPPFGVNWVTKLNRHDVDPVE